MKTSTTPPISLESQPQPHQPFLEVATCEMISHIKERRGFERVRWLQIVGVPILTKRLSTSEARSVAFPLCEVRLVDANHFALPTNLLLALVETLHDLSTKEGEDAPHSAPG